jgi:hypothetical protein
MTRTREKDMGKDQYKAEKDVKIYNTIGQRSGQCMPDNDIGSVHWSWSHNLVLRKFALYRQTCMKMVYTGIDLHNVFTFSVLVK